MARTLDPNGTVDDFVRRIRGATARTAIELAAIPSSDRHRLIRRRGLVNDLGFRIGTEWELFQHRWHIACISKEPSVFVAALQTKLDTAVAALPGHGMVPGLAGFRPTYPKRLTADQIEALLDGSGWNITFRTLEDWKRETRKDFTKRYAAKAARAVASPEDACVLELVKAVRDRVAHGSSKSLQVLNACITQRADPKVGPGLTGSVNDALMRGDKKQVRSVGVYLRGRASPGKPRRIDALADRLVTIATHLKV